MSAPESRRFLEDARDEASGYLGRELTDAEWAEAYPPAAQKLSGIIQRFGDGGGDRRQPWYLGKLVQEQISFSIARASPIPTLRSWRAGPGSWRSTCTPLVWNVPTL